MTPEAKVKKQVKEFLTALGDCCWFYMPMNFGYGRKGIPDFVGCYKGMFFSIETKSRTGKTAPWQEREAAAIKVARGHHLREIISVASVESYFFNILGRP